ncbi:heme lyase NrfEFG subunit NrfF [Shewanella putrefaciens]|uniref:Formate-dependent nitrite reductase complex subunit n=4 Tax=Shewanella putrefaciens TaxID=24 RepID=E6XQZ4_SHEP2|nr:MULTISPECIES: heme lyase NrfEFG subunit NrfF [Shewanella]CAD6364740.1 Cytochrome c-type biogenesis protein CcmH [Shewanella hafniensis]ABM23045.1 cytochrome C biogenesis protein [Shewanella sp. W3-18-1]AVV84301.1 cytochrome C biogenesis protein [Shewanella putrefaciens]MCA1898965.1 heme lyase NrfEFG subunit NrfF [Shewanella putrefaciens]MCK7631166.1 heme lyase NrfEFG subunit NrfF [Shewanella sp. JNE9-1]
MKILLKLVSGLVLVLSMVTSAIATPVDTYEFKSPDNQKRALSLAHSLRCPQCQNQNLIDSNSPVASDLRLEVFKMVDEGKGDDEIIEFMTSRYGEFVLYKPKMEAKTYILWLGPIGLLIIGLAIGYIFIRKQRISGNTPQEISAEDQQALDALLKRNSK